MQHRPLAILAALAAATEPDLGRATLDRFKGALRERYGEDPMGTTVTAVLVGSWLFYRAERGHNPKVTSYYDALVYVSTCLSVGYGEIFAKTAAGKTIGTALMTFGPAMANGILDEPSKEANDDANRRAVLERLDKIVAALEARAVAIEPASVA